jgi:hypothetical protein
VRYGDRASGGRDRLGEQVVNELVDWFNQVDATYRADLKQLNELNFARFEAKLEAFKMELLARDDVLATRIEKMRSDVMAEVHQSFAKQTRFFFLAWAVLLASNIALSFRG